MMRLWRRSVELDKHGPIPNH